MVVVVMKTMMTTMTVLSVDPTWYCNLVISSPALKSRWLQSAGIHHVVEAMLASRMPLL